MQRPSVDLPQPDSPTRPSASPRATVRSTPSTARSTSICVPAHAAHERGVEREVHRRGRAPRAAACRRVSHAAPAPRGSGRPWRGRRPSAIERRIDGRAVGVRDLAARVEAAARGRRDEVGRHAGDRLEVRAALVEVGHRAQQRARVRMAGRAEHLGDRARLDDARGVHHRDALAGLRDHREVVGDEHLREPISARRRASRCRI